MLKYLYRVSFLTTLDIYKAYFKSHHIREYKENICKKWPSALFSLKKILHFCALEFCNKVLFDLHCWWSEELCSQHLFQVASISHVLGSVHHWLVMCWDLCIELEDCHYNTSPIGYWGKGSTIGWYFPIRKQITCIKSIFHRI